MKFYQYINESEYGATNASRKDFLDKINDKLEPYKHDLNFFIDYKRDNIEMIVFLAEIFIDELSVRVNIELTSEYDPEADKNWERYWYPHLCSYRKNENYYYNNKKNFYVADVEQDTWKLEEVLDGIKRMIHPYDTISKACKNNLLRLNIEDAKEYSHMYSYLSPEERMKLLKKNIEYFRCLEHLTEPEMKYIINYPWALTDRDIKNWPEDLKEKWSRIGNARKQIGL